MLTVGFQAWTGRRFGRPRSSTLLLSSRHTAVAALWAWCPSLLGTNPYSLLSSRPGPYRQQKRPWPKLCWRSCPNKLCSISSIKTCPPPTRSPPEPAAACQLGLPTQEYARSPCFLVGGLFFFFKAIHVFFTTRPPRPTSPSPAGCPLLESTDDTSRPNRLPLLLSPPLPLF